MRGCWDEVESGFVDGVEVEILGREAGGAARETCCESAHVWGFWNWSLG